ncbi:MULTISPECIES: hypothetical protein [Pseudoalteromonas]|uniref:hypothetical protein n=1 Tax=Pseudoalteromonas TaxID=53246 RepID=UPI0013FE3892|nr:MULTISPECIES: hypothetical protein [Pseudoalteromonas]MBB1276920.1 hypothetical protein [Pseudoalteromonas sp. SR43-3]MBB1328739.1 hypothetical protein [Pseudoalteromonas sp. SR43-7]WMS92018.1 hypothetical protein RB214_06375 [Pseudoalteromonas sp. HL-AS1]|tara:strand:- start:2586 stop:4568 length:1983 start_codon:yes stop_codon:yes gene_type:complete
MENTGLPPYKELHDPNKSATMNKVDSYPKPSWMMNESVFDTTWVIAKTGYALEDNQNLTRNLTFAREVSHNELLTDKINKPLLEDVRNSLLYLNTKGKITRAERTGDILKTACHLIFHANELQKLKNQKPIRTLAEISFEHVKDYLLSFKVERLDFDKLLEIILNHWNSKGDIDWDLLKRSTTLTTRQFGSLKNRLIKYLECNHEKFRTEIGYTKHYPNAYIIEFDADRDLVPKAKTISNEISKLHCLYTARPTQKYKFRHAVQKLFSSGHTIFNEMVEPKKTPLMPVETALHTLSSALHFIRTYGLALREYLSSLNKEERAIINSNGAREHIDNFIKYQLMAFENTSIPAALNDLNLTSWRRESENYKNDFSDGISVATAVRIYIASIWILIASFSAARTTSLLTLRRNCFVQSPIDGLFDLILRIPKSSERWELEEVHRPIPDLVYDYGLEFAAFVCEIEDRRSLVCDDKESYLFTRTLNARSSTASTYTRETNEHQKALSRDALDDCLDTFFDWVESPVIDGKRWYARTHQFRRFFAVLYFNLTDGEGLDELSWFLGHASLDQTFHYAEIAPTDEWIEEAELALARIGASLNKHINADEDILAIVDKARKTSNVSTVIEPLVQKLISEHKEKTNQEVRFCRIEGEEVFFYFSGKKGY